MEWGRAGPHTMQGLPVPDVPDVRVRSGSGRDLAALSPRAHPRTRAARETRRASAPAALCPQRTQSGAPSPKNSPFPQTKSERGRGRAGPSRPPDLWGSGPDKPLLRIVKAQNGFAKPRGAAAGAAQATQCAPPPEWPGTTACPALHPRSPVVPHVSHGQSVWTKAVV